MQLNTPISTTLSIVVTVRDDRLPLWVRQTIEGLKSDGHTVRILAPDSGERGVSLLWDLPSVVLSQVPAYRLYRIFERRAGKPSIDLNERTAEPVPLDRLEQGGGCDLLLDLARRGGVASCVPRLGVLRLEIGEGRTVLDRLRSIVSGTAFPIQARLLSLDGQCKGLVRGWIPAHPFSLDRSLNRAKARLASIVQKAVNALASGQELSPAKNGHEDPIVLGGASRRYLAPIAHALLRKAMAESLRRRIERLLFVHQWALVLSTDAIDGGARGQYTIIPPADRFWADPFPLRRDGELWLFFEEQLFGASHARLACAKVRADGILEGPFSVLEKPYHLSYPYLVEEGGQLYMIPESHQNKSLDLYRCTDFPTGWEKVATLVGGQECADASVVKRADGWWLFASMRTNPGYSLSEELYAFRSDSLVSDAWKPHSGNPVATDVRNLRCAGKIFEIDGRLFRPSQDCAGGYGKAVVIHEITALAEGEFREEPRVAIPARALRGLATLHTYNSHGADVVIDGQLRRSRLVVLWARLLRKLGGVPAYRLAKAKGADISILRGLASGYYN